MAMKPCKECGTEVSSKAKTCPQCGVKHPTIKGALSCMQMLGCLGGLAVFAGVFVAIFAPGPDAPAPASQPAIAITSADLYAAYQANELAAVQAYKDRVLVVTGPVGDVGSDILNDPYVTMTAPGALIGVQCMLADGQTQRATQLREGQTVTLRGRNTGTLVSIILRECVFQ